MRNHYYRNALLFIEFGYKFVKIVLRVRIESGSLSGLEGLLEDVRGRRRLVVSVSLLQRSVAVELDRSSVVPLEPIEMPRAEE